jgi:hypothetical protein
MYGSYGYPRVSLNMDLMLVPAATTGQKLCFLPCELESDIDYTFPIDRITRIVGGRFKTSGLDGADGGIAETVTKIAGDAQYLDGPRRRDTKPY